MKTMKVLTSVLATLAIVAAWSGSAAAGSPYTKMDDEWVSLTGQVVGTTLNGFELDYGDATITVEMDDWDKYDESALIPDGERVTVYGRIDDSLFEERTIEASTVYVFSRNSYYYASSADEEGDYRFPGLQNVYPYPAEGHWMQLSGTVASVDGREFTLDVGFQDFRVDTANMSYDPLDDTGYQRVDVGDRVSVWGRMDYGLFENRELMAETVVTLHEQGEATGMES